MMNKPALKSLAALTLLLPSLLVADALTVIFDSGQTQTLWEGAAIAKDVRLEWPIPKGVISGYFPILSPSFSPGKVQRQSIKTPSGVPPLFVVGSDKISKHWLKDGKPQLLKVGAMGILAEVGDEATLKQMQTLASPLTLFPVSVETLSETLPQRHYPFVIADEEIWQ